MQVTQRRRISNDQEQLKRGEEILFFMEITVKHNNYHTSYS